MVLRGCAAARVGDQLVRPVATHHEYLPLNGSAAVTPLLWVRLRKRSRARTAAHLFESAAPQPSSMRKGEVFTATAHAVRTCGCGQWQASNKARGQSFMHIRSTARTRFLACVARPAGRLQTGAGTLHSPRPLLQSGRPGGRRTAPRPRHPEPSCTRSLHSACPGRSDHKGQGAVGQLYTLEIPVRGRRHQ